MSQIIASGRRLLQIIMFILQGAFFILLFTITYLLAGFLRRPAFWQSGTAGPHSALSTSDVASSPDSDLQDIYAGTSAETNPFSTEYYRN